MDDIRMTSDDLLIQYLFTVKPKVKPKFHLLWLGKALKDS